MLNNFTRQLISKLVHNTLFENSQLKTDELYFSEDFIQEQTSFLNSNNLHNQWLRVNVVQTLFEVGQEKREFLKTFYLDNLFILKNLMIFNSQGIEPSDKKLTEYLDVMLDMFYNEEVVDGILIDCVCDKLEDLIAISDDYINKGYITKEDLDDLIKYYLS